MKPFLILATGLALITLSALGRATYPEVGYLVGGVLVLVPVCVLARKWPRPVADESDDVERQINLQR